MEYIAYYRDSLENTPTRKFFGSHKDHATRKAIGIGKSHGWTLIEVCEAKKDFRKYGA